MFENLESEDQTTLSPINDTGDELAWLKEFRKSCVIA